MKPGSVEFHEARATEYRRLADVREEGGYKHMADEYRQMAAYEDLRARLARNS